jgi:aminoglycoside 3-N-acetyltransferase I
METVIKKLKAHQLNEFVDLIGIFEEVFEMENFSLPGKEHLQALLNKPGFMVFVATVDNHVVGGLTAYTLDQYYSEKPLAYIYDLAVLEKYQRQGIGKMLVASITSFCEKSGYEEVFVQADKADDYALDFYRKTSITNEEEVVHFYYRLGQK